MTNSKRRILSLALALCMILSLLPMSAGAAGTTHTISSQADWGTLIGNTSILGSGDTIVLSADVTGNIVIPDTVTELTIDGGGNTITGGISKSLTAIDLTLKNLTVAPAIGSYSHAIHFWNGGTLTTVGTVALTGGANPGSMAGHGVLSDGSLTITASNDTTFTGGDGSTGGGCGVYMVSGDLTLSGGSPTFRGGNGPNGYGVRLQDGDLIITSGSPTFTGGVTASDNGMRGAEINGDLIISSSGSPAFTGADGIGSSDNGAHGAYVSGALTISAGSPVFQGGAVSDASQYAGYGVFVNGATTISGSASPSFTGGAAETSGFGGYGMFSFGTGTASTSGTVTVTAGNNQNIGLSINNGSGTLDLSGLSGTFTATGGTTAINAAITYPSGLDETRKYDGSAASYTLDMTAAAGTTHTISSQADWGTLIGNTSILGSGDTIVLGASVTGNISIPATVTGLTIDGGGNTITGRIWISALSIDLTLKNLAVAPASGISALRHGGGTLTTVGTVALTGGDNPSGNAGHGVLGDGSLTITASDSTTFTGGDGSSTAGCGVYMKSGDLTLSGSSPTFRGGNGSYGYGAETQDGDLIITSGSPTFTGADGIGYSGAQGARITGALTISAGSPKFQGGAASGASQFAGNGISVRGTATISGSASPSFTGGTAVTSGYGAHGMFSDGTVTVSTSGTVTITAGNNPNVGLYVNNGSSTLDLSGLSGIFTAAGGTTAIVAAITYPSGLDDSMKYDGSSASYTLDMTAAAGATHTISNQADWDALIGDTSVLGSGDTIVLSASVSGNISIPDTVTELTIDGGGNTITGRISKSTSAIDLTLKNLAVAPASGNAALWLKGGTLTTVGTVALTGGDNPSGIAGDGVSNSGNLTITASDSTTFTGGVGSSARRGVYMISGDLTLSGGSPAFRGGNGTGGYGAETQDGDLIITSGSPTFTGGVTSGGYGMRGAKIRGDLIISSSGSPAFTGADGIGSSGNSAYGAYVSGALEISAGSPVFQGGAASDTSRSAGDGVFVNGTVTISGSASPSFTGGAAVSSGYGGYGILSFGSVTASTSGTVTITAGNNGNIGLYVNNGSGTLDLSGLSGIFTATGGTTAIAAAITYPSGLDETRKYDGSSASYTLRTPITISSQADWDALIGDTSVLGSGDTIVLGADVTGNISIPDTVTELTIDGGGNTITGRIWISASAIDLTLKDLTVAPASGSGNSALRLGGGTLTTVGTVVLTGDDNPGGSAGEGVSSSGTLTITASDSTTFTGGDGSITAGRGVLIISGDLTLSGGSPAFQGGNGSDGFGVQLQSGDLIIASGSPTFTGGVTSGGYGIQGAYIGGDLIITSSGSPTFTGADGISNSGGNGAFVTGALTISAGSPVFQGGAASGASGSAGNGVFVNGTTEISGSASPSFTGGAAETDSFGGSGVLSNSTVTVSTSGTVTVTAGNNGNVGLYINYGSSTLDLSGLSGIFTATGGTTAIFATITYPSVLDEARKYDGSAASYTLDMTAILDSLTVSLTAGAGKVTLAPQAAAAGFTYYYKATAADDSANKPAFDSTNLSGWTAYDTATDITGAAGTAIYVQVIKVANGTNKIKAWGQDSATPTSNGGNTVGTGVGSTTPGNKITAPTTDSGWSDAAKKVNDLKDGSDFTIDMKNNTTVSGDFLEAVAGKDVDITFDMGGGMSWEVNGKDIPKDTELSALDLGVTTGTAFIPVEVRNIDGSVSEVQMRLAHNGEFGFTLTLSVTLDVKNAGYFANLYYYNEATDKLEFRSAAKIATDGTTEFVFDHASDYLIVVSETSLAPEVWQNPFTDVSETHWFYGDVQYAVENGLFSGTSDTTFSPGAPMTRGMLVTVLGRMAEIDPAEYAVPSFDDTPAGAYYSPYVSWAAQMGIVTGYNEGTFGPNDAITRQDVAVVLTRYMAYAEINLPVTQEYRIFADEAQIADYAKDAVQTMNKLEVLRGVGENTINPRGNATRAEVAAMLHRFMELVK